MNLQSMFPRFNIPLLLAILIAWGGIASGQDLLSSNFSLQTDGTHPFGDLTTRYRVQQWKVEQGMPQNHVTCLMQSHDGYVWVGTVFGLARYDGVRFTVFEKSSLPLMVETDDHIMGLAEDRDHAIWVCTRNGLLRRQDHTWTAYTTGGPELGKYQPTGVCDSRDGGVWIGVQGAIMRFDKSGPKESIKLEFSPPVRSVRMLAEDNRGRVWAADRYRVMRWDPEEKRAVMVFDYSKAIGWVHYLFKDPDDGTIRFGGQSGAYKIENDKPRLIGGFKTSSAGTLTNTVFAIADDGHGRVWTAEDGRLVQSIVGKAGEEPQEIGVHRHPGLTSVEKLLRDADGNLWVGTEYDGLLFIKEHHIATLIAPGGRTQNNLWSVCEDNEGAIWIGSSRDLLRWHHNELTPFGPPPSSIPSGLVFSVAPDPKGGIWVGYAGYGLFHFDGSRWIPSPQANLKSNAMNELNTRSILTRRDGSVWFGTLNGLYSWSKEQLVHYTKTNGLPANDVRALHEDREGNLWIGTYNDGLSRYSQGKFQNFGRQEGLKDLQISAFLEEADGSLWIGTSSGLARYRQGIFRTLTRKEGLYDNLVNHIVADDYGSYWISCNRGIYRISKEEARDVADGKLDVLTSIPFGESEGMQSAETNGGSQPAGWKSRDGILWFPTGNGLVRIDPKDFLITKSRPSVVIEQVIANGVIRYGDGADSDPQAVQSNQRRWSEEGSQPERPFHLKFPAGQAGVVEIRYTANSFGDPSKVRFQYRMIGHDRGWQEAGDRRVAHYTNLDPGDYEFEIRACNSHGLWGPIDRHLTFNIAHYFHQTWWFYSLALLGVLASVMAIQSYRLKTQRKILQLEKEHALEKERARIAKDMHDDLGARLTQLGMISQAIESPGFQTHPGESSPLPRISALARDAVRSLDEIVWAVSPGKNSLDQLAGYLVQSAQDLITPSGLRFELQMPAQIPPLPLTSELRHNVFLVSKEALNNAVKHSGGNCIRLEFSHNPTEACVIISDDGDGFIIADAAGAGNGLANMRKRAESVGASFALMSQRNQGTRIEVRFPLSAAEPR